jgi:hypothetical protein
MKQSMASFTLLLKQSYQIALVALLLATGLVFTGFSHVPTAHAAPSRPMDCTAGQTCHGCPPGYVCIYPEGSTNGVNDSTPTQKFYYYGVYQLHNQYGQHEIINNQVDSAWAFLCTDWQGANCTWLLGPLTLGTYDLTPINTIKVKPDARG